MCFKLNLFMIKMLNVLLCEKKHVLVCLAALGKLAQSDPAATPENFGSRGLLDNTKSCPSWLD